MAINGAKVRELRQIAGISQSNLANRIGVSQAMVSQIELNCRACKPDTIKAIAAEFGYSFEYLAGEPSTLVQLVRICKRLSESQLSALHKIAIELAKIDSPPKAAELSATTANAGSLQCPFVLVESFADNGDHSHWSLVHRETGEEEWSQQASA